MTGDLASALRDIRRGPVARRLLADILDLAEREGILERIRRLSPLTAERLCGVLRSDLGYVPEQGNRRRMIALLLGLLAECGRVKEAGGAWHWRGEDTVSAAGDAAGIPADRPSVETDGQYLFFRECLRSVPAYLRGGPAALQFDRRSAGTWERFLGCAEFRSCRAALLALMALEARPAPRVLDLCHGPGWGVEAVVRRFPAARVTALDFTDAFHRTARARADLAQALHRDAGHPVTPIVWVGPDRWGGFGRPLPFADGEFDAVLFTCGDPYIPAGRRGDVYRDIARVLTPDGKLGILTRCRPDADAHHVASFWLRISALAHDFAESVCAGWEGFSDAEENARLFADAGFRGGAEGRPDAMSFLDSSLWVLRKARGDA
jgi:SAM-dependent methyltransferase